MCFLFCFFFFKISKLYVVTKWMHACYWPYDLLSWAKENWWVYGVATQCKASGPDSRVASAARTCAHCCCAVSEGNIAVLFLWSAELELTKCAALSISVFFSSNSALYTVGKKWMAVQCCVPWRGFTLGLMTPLIHLSVPWVAIALGYVESVRWQKKSC